MLTGIGCTYCAFVPSTKCGLQAVNIIQQFSAVATPDSRIYCFFGIAFGILIVVEGAAQLVHNQIQIEAIVFNHVSGVVVGVLTAIILSVLVTYELQAAGNPFGGTQLDSLQLNIRDAINNSHLAVPLTSALKRPIIAIFDPVLPTDPQIYFRPGPVNA